MEDERVYSKKIRDLLKYFKFIDRLSIRKHENYSANLFIDYEEDQSELDSDLDYNDYLPKDTVNKNVTQLIYEGPYIDKHEIEMLAYLLPNVKWLMVSGENILET